MTSVITYIQSVQGRTSLAAAAMYKADPQERSGWHPGWKQLCEQYSRVLASDLQVDDKLMSALIRGAGATDVLNITQEAIYHATLRALTCRSRACCDLLTSGAPLEERVNSLRLSKLLVRNMSLQDLLAEPPVSGLLALATGSGGGARTARGRRT